MEIGQTTHGNLHQATHGNFSFITLPFPVLCRTMGCLRVCHSLYITPRGLGHAPTPLVSDPNGRLQHNVSRHDRLASQDPTTTRSILSPQWTEWRCGGRVESPIEVTWCSLGETPIVMTHGSVERIPRPGKNKKYANLYQVDLTWVSTPSCEIVSDLGPMS